MATLKHMPHSGLQWDGLYNDNLDELDARTTANGGGIQSTTVSGGLIWMNGAHAEHTQVKYYQLKDSKRVVINASWVILNAPEQGQTNNGLLIGRVPDSLKPSHVIASSMSDCWTAILYTNGEIRAWCSDKSRYNIAIPSGSITLCLEYETN